MIIFDRLWPESLNCNVKSFEGKKNENIKIKIFFLSWTGYQNSDPKVRLFVTNFGFELQKLFEVFS